MEWEAAGQDLGAVTGTEPRLGDATQRKQLQETLSLRPPLPSSSVHQDLLVTHAMTVGCSPDMARPWWVVSQLRRRCSPHEASSHALMKPSSGPQVELCVLFGL